MSAFPAYDPPGLRFFDRASGRHMLLVSEGSHAGWLCWRHPDGQWVTLRKATDADRSAIDNAASAIVGGFLQELESRLRDADAGGARWYNSSRRGGSMTCATCVHWRDDPNNDRGAREFAVLDANYYPVAPQPFELHECLSRKVRFYERPEEDGVSLMDGSEYFATMVTGPNFGCIHHEPYPQP